MVWPLFNLRARFCAHIRLICLLLLDLGQIARMQFAKAAAETAREGQRTRPLWRYISVKTQARSEVDDTQRRGIDVINAAVLLDHLAWLHTTTHITERLGRKITRITTQTPILLFATAYTAHLICLLLSRTGHLRITHLAIRIRAAKHPRLRRIDEHHAQYTHYKYPLIHTHRIARLFLGLFNCHGFRQIARLIDIGAACNTATWYASNCSGTVKTIGAMQSSDRRDRQHGYAIRCTHACFGIGEDKQFTAARTTSWRLDFSFSSKSLFGATDDHRHIRIDQRQRAMLEFSRRIRLGVDIGNFLELERAFHRHRELRPATQGTSA